MSSRGSRPKISSESFTLPASLPPSVVILRSIIPLPLWPEPRSWPATARIAAGFGALAGSAILTASRTRIQAPFEPGNRTADQDQAAIDVGRNDLDILRGDAGVAHVAGHLLALEHLAGVLALTGRTVRAVRHRDAVASRGRRRSCGASWRPGKPLPIVVPVTSTFWPATKWSAVISAPTSSRLSADTRNSATFAFGSTVAIGEMAAQRLRRVLHLGQAGAELNGGVAVLLLRALRHDLAVLHAENGHRDMLAGVVVDAGHAHLLCDHT